VSEDERCSSFLRLDDDKTIDDKKGVSLPSEKGARSHAVMFAQPHV
jgi:hypothetical protein